MSKKMKEKINAVNRYYMYEFGRELKKKEDPTDIGLAFTTLESYVGDYP